MPPNAILDTGPAGACIRPVNPVWAAKHLRVVARISAQTLRGQLANLIEKGLKNLVGSREITKIRLSTSNGFAVLKESAVIWVPSLQFVGVELDLLIGDSLGFRLLRNCFAPYGKNRGRD